MREIYINILNIIFLFMVVPGYYYNQYSDRVSVCIFFFFCSILKVFILENAQSYNCPLAFC